MYTNYLRIITITACCAMSSACGDVILDTVLSRLDSSETVGKNSMTLDVGIKGGELLKLEDRKSRNAPSIDQYPSSRARWFPNVAYTYGPTDWLDFRVGAAFDMASDLMRTVAPSVRGKIQWLGIPQAASGTEAFSLATTLGISAYDNNPLSSVAYDAALIAGYRTNPRYMFFGGPFFNRSDYDYTWHHTSNEKLQTQGQYRGHVETWGGNIAMQVTLPIELTAQIELVAARIDAEKTHKYVAQLGAQFSRRW